MQAWAIGFLRITVLTSHGLEEHKFSTSIHTATVSSVLTWYNYSIGILKYRNEIMTAYPRLSTESAFELEAAAFNNSTTMVSLYV